MGRICYLLPLLLALPACQQHPAAAAGNPQRRELPETRTLMSQPILSYADVVDAVAPAVVTVRATHREHPAQQFPFSELFQQFLGEAPQAPRNQVEIEEALGSGVIIRPNGYIVTNFHVIDGAQNIKIDLSDGRTFAAKVTGSDPPSDLAVLQISAAHLPALAFGDSGKVRVGDVCLALGNPFDVGQSVTAGIISAKSRTTSLMGSGSFQDFLQTDASINQGNSGGALVNTRGELIGINSQIIAPNGGGSVGIGFAIPSGMAKNVTDQLIAHKKVERGTLGVTIQAVTSDIASSLGLPKVEGALVLSVNPAGPAAEAGVKQGDVILEANGADATSPNELRNQIAALGPGADVTLTLWRNGSQHQVHARLGALAAQSAGESGNASQCAPGRRLGITVEPLTPGLAAQLGVSRNTQGVAIVSVDPNGPAAQAGIQAGDVIQQVNQQPVRTPADLENGLRKPANRPALLLIDRGGQTLYVAVPLS